MNTLEIKQGGEKSIQVKEEQLNESTKCKQPLNDFTPESQLLKNPQNNTTQFTVSPIQSTKNLQHLQQSQQGKVSSDSKQNTHSSHPIEPSAASPIDPFSLITIQGILNQKQPQLQQQPQISPQTLEKFEKGKNTLPNLLQQLPMKQQQQHNDFSKEKFHQNPNTNFNKSYHSGNNPILNNNVSDLHNIRGGNNNFNNLNNMQPLNQQKSTMNNHNHFNSVDQPHPSLYSTHANRAFDQFSANNQINFNNIGNNTQFMYPNQNSSNNQNDQDNLQSSVMQLLMYIQDMQSAQSTQYRKDQSQVLGGLQSILQQQFPNQNSILNNSMQEFNLNDLCKQFAHQHKQQLDSQYQFQEFSQQNPLMFNKPLQAFQNQNLNFNALNSNKPEVFPNSVKDIHLPPSNQNVPFKTNGGSSSFNPNQIFQNLTQNSQNPQFYLPLTQSQLNIMKQQSENLINSQNEETLQKEIKKI